MLILNSVAALLIACSIWILPTSTNADRCAEIMKAGLNATALFYESWTCETEPSYTIPLDACPTAKYNVKKDLALGGGIILPNKNVTLFIKDKSSSLSQMLYGDDWWGFSRARCIDCDVSFMKTSFDAKKCISACDEAKRGNLLEFLSDPESCTSTPRAISETEIGNTVPFNKEIAFYVPYRGGCILKDTESKASFFAKHGCFPLPIEGKKYDFKCYSNFKDSEFIIACDLLVENGDFQVAFYSDVSCTVQTFAIPINAPPGTKITAKKISNTGMWVVRRGFNATFKTGSDTTPYDAGAYNYDDSDADQYEVTAVKA